jgi:hypothetical protein
LLPRGLNTAVDEQLVQRLIANSARKETYMTSTFTPNKLGRLESAQTVRLDPVAVIQKACKQFIKGLGECQVFQLCRNGSIWIDEADFVGRRVTKNSFTAMGPSSDGAIREYGDRIRAVCLIDFEGIADGFVYSEDEDEEGNPVKPARHQLMYTPKSGRRELLDCLVRNLEFDLESLEVSFCERERAENWR